jgi:protein involved in polysaccharide export with SLBB domain
MPYLVRAEVKKPGSGTFKTEAETKRDAIEKAQGAALPRARGLNNGPDGVGGR